MYTINTTYIPYAKSLNSSDNSIPEDRHIGPIENTPLKRPTGGCVDSERWRAPKMVQPQTIEGYSG